MIAEKFLLMIYLIVYFTYQKLNLKSEHQQQAHS